MTTFARVPVVPGPVAEIYIGTKLFPMHESYAAAWYTAPDGTQQKYNYDGTVFTLPTALEPTQSQLAQAAAEAAIKAGIIVTSSVTPSLNATYNVDPSATANINAVATYIMLNNLFPGKATTMPWIDKTGAPHIFPDILTFKAFASEIADFISTVSIYASSGGAVGAIPNNQIAIP